MVVTRNSQHQIDESILLDEWIGDQAQLQLSSRHHEGWRRWSSTGLASDIRRSSKES